MKRIILITLAAVALSCSGKNAEPASQLIEAEYFSSPGGWVVDDQFYDQLGTSYLMAHGMGIPVEDAATTVFLPRAGRYHVWVRTYNWNAPWDPSQAPGRFTLLVDGKQIGKELGVRDSEWTWQYAGRIKADIHEESGGAAVRVALHDLTGFNGKCDALFFSTERKPQFPTERKHPEINGLQKYDLIVAGAGTAGISAAIAAARLGLKTLLVNDRPVLGGNNSPEHHIGASGRLKTQPYPQLGTVMMELGNVFSNYKHAEEMVEAEKDLRVLLRHRVVGVEKEGDCIKAVKVLNLASGIITVIQGSYFADCTGDGNLGVLAGASFMQGQEARDVFNEDLAPEKPEGLSYGSTMPWSAEKADSVSSFPECPWAFAFNDSTAIPGLKHNWFWETGFYQDQVKDAELIRDAWLRIIYGNWAWLKNSPKFKDEYANARLKRVGYVLGKRESRRLKGDYILTQNDIEGDWRSRYDDPVVWCTYSIDQHFPRQDAVEKWGKDAFFSTMKHNHNPLGISRRYLKEGIDYNMPYMLPYRCLYSADVSNLFMAGRDISVSRIALCSTRVMGTTAVTGEVVGIAAACCKQLDCTPRALYTDHLPRLKAALKKGVPTRFGDHYHQN